LFPAPLASNVDHLEAERRYDDEVVGMEPLPTCFERSADRHERRPAQMYKGGVYDRSLVAADAVTGAPAGEYYALTYGSVRDLVRRLAVGFMALGLERDERVGIYADTRMEWAQADLALLATGAVVTTLYESSSPRQVQYLLDDPAAAGVVVGGRSELERVLDVIDSLNVRFVVTMDDVDGYEDRDGVYTLGEVYRQGVRRYDEDRYRDRLDSLAPTDLASLVYTSGTTGEPKGVRLSHRNLRANVNQVYVRVAPRPDRPEDAFVLDETATSVSYLPLAHIFERTVGQFLMFAAGATVGYAESPDTLSEDFQAVEPTVATSVPRVYERILDAAREEAAETEWRERLFDWAVDVARRYQRDSKPGYRLRAEHALADRLVFSRVRAALGGNVEALVSGGGSLPKELCSVYHGMGLPIYEGYGLTETAPVVTEQVPENVQVGTVGKPVVGQEVRIDDSVVPEGAFEDAIGRFGELQVKGPNVTDGYWNRPQDNDAAFTADGYFKTGDVVQLRPDGQVVFRERAKQILVLSTGKNVAPGPIEDAFTGSEVVDQVLVVGDDRKFVAALVVPEFDRLERAADREGVDLPEDPAAICASDRVRSAVQRDVDRVNEEFEPHERIKSFELVPEPWTEENGLLTPTLKKKRRQIVETYADRVEAAYENADRRRSAEPAE
jgi:long-chain acyl-CoA synthetase